jgi:hypothetical protein
MWTPAWPEGSWGSAILSRVGKPDPTWQERSGGAVVLAQLAIPSIGLVSIASVHARVMDDAVIRAQRGTFETMRSHLRSRFIVGGDLNTARLAATAWPVYGHGEFWSDLDGCRNPIRSTGFVRPVPPDPGPRP